MIMREGIKRGKIINKKSQVTLWIIIAIVIIALIALIFYLTPLKTIFFPSIPQVEFEGCVEKIDEALELIGERGGSMNPALGYAYEGEKIEYLCYTNQYYKTCTMQQPLLKQHMEREILDYIKPETLSCIENVKNDLRKQGWQVSGDSDLNIEILQDNIKISISGINLRKEDTGESYKKFEFYYKSRIYDLIMITSSILNWEARYGDSETTTYMAYYPNIKVEKYKQEDGSKVYKLTERESQEKFVFATRSLSWPGGYGFGEIYTTRSLSLENEKK